MATVVPSLESYVYERGMATIEAALSASNYTASPWLYDDLPTGTRDVGALSYGIGLLRTEMVAPESRQRAAESINLRSDVGARILARIRPDNVRADYATALLVDAVVRAALITAADGYTASVSSGGAQKWRWINSTRRGVADSTHLLIEQTYTVWHDLTSI